MSGSLNSLKGYMKGGLGSECLGFRVLGFGFRVRLGPHPIIVTTRGNGIHIRVLIYF